MINMCLIYMTRKNNIIYMDPSKGMQQIHCIPCILFGFCRIFQLLQRGRLGQLGSLA